MAAVELLEYEELGCEYPAFKMKVDAGSIKIGETVGVVGPNAIGKTTFVKMLAGVQAPTTGKVARSVRVSYKPQYITPDFDGTVQELFHAYVKDFFESGFFQTEIAHPMVLKPLLEKNVKNLSGGELQTGGRGALPGKGRGHLSAGRTVRIPRFQSEDGDGQDDTAGPWRNVAGAPWSSTMTYISWTWCPIP